MDGQLGALLGESPRIAEIRAQVAQLIARQPGARRLAPVLILGETGTGKGLLARTIHQAGARSAGPFVDINCAAIPESLLEAEIFGYERGAFTDARQAKPGLFQTAHGGTLFLDEIGLLPSSLQSKLLTVLEDRVVRRLGSTRAERVDVALMAATSVDLKRAVGARRFREDLYHRLAVITLELPPLRARGADIVALAEHFLARACVDYGESPRELAPGARDLLANYRWPGNVRELANAMERVVLLWDPDVITAAMLGFLGQHTEAAEAAGAAEDADPTDGGTLDAALRTRIEGALRQAGGNIRRTAIALGISRNTLRARMDKYGLRRHDASLPDASVVSFRQSRLASLRWERRHLAVFRARLLSRSTSDRSRTLEVIAEKVESFGGRIEESGPAGVLAVFGLEPVDNAPSHAALAALAVQRAAHDRRDAAAHAPQVVIALHCAEHLVARTQASFQIGLDDKRAAWSTLDALVAEDDPGAIAVSAAAVPFLARRFILEGPRDGREAWRVRGRQPAGAAGSTAGFVGRRAELEILRQVAARAERGQGQIVGVVGEAGVGKSRLFLEAVRRLHDWHVLACGGATYARNAAYFPLVELLKRYCHVEDTDTAPQVRDKIVRQVPGQSGDPAQLLSPILDLFGMLSEDEPFRQMDPVQRRRRTQDAIKQVLLLATSAQPLCLVVEDLHWIDSETLAVLDLLVESITASRVLLLTNYRPKHQHRWGSRSAYTQVRLDPLPAEGAEKLLRALLGGDPSLEELRRTLLDRTEGNPFFIEECVRALVETGIVVGTASNYRLGELRGDSPLPATVQAVIAARIDRLARDDRGVLQSAAAIGKDVPVPILRSITEVTGAAFDAALASLRDAEFMHETRAYPDLEYTFKHALTQEVAYDGLLPEARRALHARIVEAIERLHSDRLAEHVEQLVYHGTRGELWDKAAHYAHEAGLKAGARSAHPQAVQYFEQGLAALEHLPRTRDNVARDITLRLAARASLFQLGEAALEHEHLRRAESLALEIDDQIHLAQTAVNIAQWFWASGDARSAVETADRGVRILSALGLEQHYASVYLAQALHLRGDYGQAIEVSTDTVRQLQDPGATVRTGWTPATITARYWLAISLAAVGEFPLAIARGSEALALAEARSENHHGVFHACLALGVAHLMRGEVDPAIALLERSARAVRTVDLRLMAAVAEGYLCHGYGLAGRFREAIDLVERTFAETGHLARGFDRVRQLNCLGDAYLSSGQSDRAASSAETALSLATELGQLGNEADARRLLGDVTAHVRSDPDVAMLHYREALTQAMALGMRPLVARCRAGLARLCRRIGQEDQAQQHRTAAAALYREMDMRFWLDRLDEP